MTRYPGQLLRARRRTLTYPLAPGGARSRLQVGDVALLLWLEDGSSGYVLTGGRLVLVFMRESVFEIVA